MWEAKFNSENFISSGCLTMDSFLKGGFCRRGITQIYGESGIGKTQLALQLCLAAQISTKNLSDGAAYICTETLFPSNRLHELLKKSPLVEKYSISNEMIFIEHVSNTEDLENCIMNNKRLPYLLSEYNIKLIVIDSVAATYRVEYDISNLKSRAKSLRNMGYHLQNLALSHRLAVVCINQISANLRDNFTDISIGEQPSLGSIWANMITNSFHMYKNYNRRYICSKGSPYLSNQTLEYEILDSGVVAKSV